jgi:hypothetical protein
MSSTSWPSTPDRVARRRSRRRCAARPESRVVRHPGATPVEPRRDPNPWSRVGRTSRHAIRRAHSPTLATRARHPARGRIRHPSGDRSTSRNASRGSRTRRQCHEVHRSTPAEGHRPWTPSSGTPRMPRGRPSGCARRARPRDASGDRVSIEADRRSPSPRCGSPVVGERGFRRTRVRRSRSNDRPPSPRGSRTPGHPEPSTSPASPGISGDHSGLRGSNCRNARAPEGPFVAETSQIVERACRWASSPKHLGSRRSCVPPPTDVGRSARASAGGGEVTARVVTKTQEIRRENAPAAANRSVSWRISCVLGRDRHGIGTTAHSRRAQ